jgi:hypothetical protein
MTYDWSKVSRETALEIVEAFATSQPWPEDALRRARGEASPPLRTRAERDRELVDLLGGSAHAPQHGKEITFNIERENLHRILDLIVESTAPDPERCTAADLAFDCLDPQCKAHDRVLTETEQTATDPDPLHPTGRCTCAGEGDCEWCKAIIDCEFPDPCSCEEALGLREKLRVTTGLLTAIELDIHHALVNLK